MSAVKDWYITFNVENHPVVGSGTLSGGRIDNLPGRGDGILFDYFNDKFKRVFLEYDKYPEIRDIYDSVKAENEKTKKEREARVAREIEKEREANRGNAQFGWCNACESYCYGDCQA